MSSPSHSPVSSIRSGDPRRTDVEVVDDVEEVERLRSEVVRLKQELWVARDAAMGAVAELGTARARIVELEALIGQLHAELGGVPDITTSRVYKVGLLATSPARAARKAKHRLLG